MAAKSTASGDGGTGKKPYESPRLDVYGDIREIAKSTGQAGHVDGAGHGNTKTN